MGAEGDALLAAVGKRRIHIVAEDTGELLATGVLVSAHYEAGPEANSAAEVALDNPPRVPDGQ